MDAQLIDGRSIAERIRREVAESVADIVARGGRPPGLGTILVGTNPASMLYVAAKNKACLSAGIHSVQHQFPATITEPELLAQVRALNDDPTIDGILVQLPLPQHIRESEVIRAISPLKDVDGFHPENAGLLAIGTPRFVPCTPLGIQELFRRERIDTRGRHAVIVGRSNIVGRPLANLLSMRGEYADATVTLAHSQSRDLPALLHTADILVAAIGKPLFVRGDWVKPGAVVVDVGINRVDDPSSATGHRLVGDVAFDEAKFFASAITPVPKGVGPMTIAMLLRNTLDSRRRASA